MGPQWLHNAWLWDSHKSLLFLHSCSWCSPCPTTTTMQPTPPLLTTHGCISGHPSPLPLTPPPPPPPQVSSFSSTLKGLPTIRAYSAQGRFHRTFLEALSVNGSWWYAFVTLGRWVGLRLDLVASSTLAAGALLAMALRTSVRPELVGLALVYVLQVGCTGMGGCGRCVAGGRFHVD